MRRVLARVIYGVAVLALAVSFFAIRRSSDDVFAYAITLPEGIPAVVYEPGPPRAYGEPPRDEAPLPTVVLAHGFASDKSTLDMLARRLARAGYAVITFDFRGHGQSRMPFERVREGRGGLLEDMSAAVAYARAHPRLDGTRIAVGGHSMGASAALRYASYESGVAAVIGISGGTDPEGPYPVQNLLLIWAEGAPDRTRIRLRDLGARISGLARLVLDRTYRDPRRGEAIRLSEVPGSSHLRILFSSEATRRILDWLDATLGPGRAGGGDPLAGGVGWLAALGTVATLVLLWGLPAALAPAFPRADLREIDAPLGRLGLLLAALVGATALVSGSAAVSGGGPLGFVPIVVGREGAALFAVSGLLLCLVLARRGALPASRASALSNLAAAGLVFGFGYLALAGAISPYLEVGLGPRRLPWWILCSALALPYFVATELLLRGRGRAGLWLPIAGKALTLLAIALAAGLGLLPRVILLALGGIAALFAVLELVAYRLGRSGFDPWVQALVQSAWVGHLLARWPMES
jgi:alpha-beta hydrolase superfamily lysophospholipase